MSTTPRPRQWAPSASDDELAGLVELTRILAERREATESALDARDAEIVRLHLAGVQRRDLCRAAKLSPNPISVIISSRTGE